MSERASRAAAGAPGARRAHDRAYGARPLKRAIQKLIQDPMALKILEGEVLHGDHVVVDADIPKRQMIFTVSGRAAAESTRESRTA